MHKRLPTEVAVTLDFETYYDGEYSLRKIPTVNYVRDERFEVHMLSWRSRDLGIERPQRAIGFEAVQRVVDMLKEIQDAGVGVRIVGHNLSFDSLILHEHFKFTSPFYFDTSLLPVLVYGNTLRDLKLETLAQRLNLPVDTDLRNEALHALGLTNFEQESKKLSSILAQVKGKRLHEIPPALLTAYAAYCDIDVLLTDGVYDAIVSKISNDALYVQDMHLHACVTSPLKLDVATLQAMRDDYVETRDFEVSAFGDACGVPFDGMKSIRSKAKYAQLLVDMGVPEHDLPRKKNKKGEDIYAFATNDLALENLPDAFPHIDLLAEAVRLRLSYNSTAVESKLKRFSSAGESSPDHSWAFHVKPFGARNTARHSGGSAFGASPQNMARAKKIKPEAYRDGIPHRQAAHITVRDAIQARDGKELCVADLSGIELRTCMWIANDLPAMEVLSDPTRDLYTEDGRVYFNKPDMTKDDGDLRQAAKVTDLAAQYLTGWRKILHQAKLWKIPMTAEQAQTLHKMYRVRHPAVVMLWSQMEQFMHDLSIQKVVPHTLGVLDFSNKGIHLPNGFLLRYPDLRYEWRERRYTYWNASKRCRVNVHSGLIVENCSQALSANVFNDVLIRTNERLHEEFIGVEFVGDVHDEMLFSCDEGDGAQVLSIMLEEMSRPLPWWPGFVTFAEGDHGYSTMENFDGTVTRASRSGCLK